MRRIPSLPVLFILMAALLAIALAAGIAWMRLNGDRDRISGTTSNGGEVTVATGIQIGGPFTLTAADGKRVTDQDFLGKFQLVYFGYTYCPDVCPTELAAIANALDLMGPAADKVTPIFITVDPERDTPEAMGEYVQHFHPRLVGLSGSVDEIGKVASEYRVFFRKVDDKDSTEYLMDHSTFIYLMGPDGKFVTMFRYGTDPAEMAKVMTGYVASAN